jgi:hypothetical protein
VLTTKLAAFVRASSVVRREISGLASFSVFEFTAKTASNSVWASAAGVWRRSVFMIRDGRSHGLPER